MFPDMASLAQKIEAEKRMRELLAENGLPEPDLVEYGIAAAGGAMNASALDPDG